MRSEHDAARAAATLGAGGVAHEHPQRYALTNELHARPFEQLSPPARLSMHANLIGEHDDGIHDHLEDICARFGLDPPARNKNQFSADFGPFRLRFERHTEFASYTIIRLGAFDDPFAVPAAGYLPEGWLDAMPGESLVATHLALMPAQQTRPDADALTEWFMPESLVSSLLSDDAAQVWTDLRIHPDGHNRILVQAHDMPAHKAGRMVQWLLEIAAYRNFALLALPIARQLSPRLSRIDVGLAELTAEMAALADGGVNDVPASRESELLEHLMQLSSEIERLNSGHYYRFAASRAYFALVWARLDELREIHYDDYQTIGEFLRRRLTPAMRTCESVSERLMALSERATRAANLLQTRVDFFLKRQNQGLLNSMDRRANLQLRLQQTVEGLSVVAISYYAVGLVGYAAKGLHSAGVGVSVTLVQGVAVPVIVLMVGWGLHRLRGRIEKNA
ncbi:MAG: hypothetical protein CMN28_08770 [Salinisphaeraceae bacterium]|nr:hypothetical protein [Salinisphaeraceae bacterium]